MQAIGASPDGGGQMVLELSDEKSDDILKLASLEFSKKDLKQKIDNLDVSADTKSLLFTLATKVIKVGDVVVKIGQKILETVVKFVSAYPHTSFGIVFGAVAGVLVGSVPIIGWVLGPIVTPIMIALGLTLGAKQDFMDKVLERRLSASIDPFRVLNV